MKKFVPAIPPEDSLPPPKIFVSLIDEDLSEIFPLYPQMVIKGW